MKQPKGGYDELDRAPTVCGARTKSGGRCKNAPIRAMIERNAPTPRCRRHGGRSLAGPAHPRWQGKGQAYTEGPGSQTLREAIAAAIIDPSVGSLTPELAVLAARVRELLTRLGTGETGEAWRRVGTLTSAARGRLPAPPPADEDGKVIDPHEDTRATLEAIGALVDDALADDRTWREIMSAIGMLTKLADTERKREESLSRIMTERDIRSSLTNFFRAAFAVMSVPEERRRVGELMQTFMRGRELATTPLLAAGAQVLTEENDGE